MLVYLGKTKKIFPSVQHIVESLNLPLDMRNLELILAQFGEDAELIRYEVIKGLITLAKQEYDSSEKQESLISFLEDKGFPHQLITEALL